VEIRGVRGASVVFRPRDQTGALYRHAAIDGKTTSLSAIGANGVPSYENIGFFLAGVKNAALG
jgi:hypothetical protein